MVFDSFDATAIRIDEVALREKLNSLNSCFESRIMPQNGYFGVTEVNKGNGYSQVTGRNQEGHISREYLHEGLIYKRRVALGNREWATFDFDDNGTSYLETVSRLSRSGATVMDVRLTPNATIVKGNFTSQIDAFGRPVLNTIKDLELRAKETARGNLSQKLRDGSYKPSDQRGHLIPDLFGGPGTKENVVAQLGKVNQGKIEQVERIAAQLKREGHQIDYSMKVNYVGSDTRPSSFEPCIVVDGEEFALPDNLKKIYNENINDGQITSKIKQTGTNIGEHFGLAHEEGLHSAGVAAALTCSVSACKNISSFVDGEIAADEMVTNIVGDTAIAGGMAYGVSFISASVSQAMSHSSNALISQVGGSSAPALVVSFGVQSYHDLSDYAQGNIDVGELAYNLGENAAEIAGGAIGGSIGAAAGAVGGPLGSLAGSVVGGSVGCALASEAYATAVEFGAEGAEAIAEQANQFATATVEAIASTAPEQLDNVRDAFNSYFDKNSLPFRV